MIKIKTEAQIEKMRVAGKVLAEGLKMLDNKAQVGVNLLDLDQAFADFLKTKNCLPNFLGYQGFPKNICISINDQLVHGIPQDRVIAAGDLVSIDAGCMYEGYNADAAFSKICGEPKSKKDVILIEVTEKSLEMAINVVKPGARIGDIGATIQNYVESFGFSVPRDYTGHGIGLDMHEDPFIPNYGTFNSGLRLREGMVICIEPMVQQGSYLTKTGPDGWTVYSVDHQNSAHFEHTILVTKTGCEVLTRDKGEKE